MTETQSAQIELDRTSQDFRTLHLERQEIVRQWEATQRQLGSRDNEICQMALDVQNLKGQISAKKAKEDEIRRIYEQERANNQALEMNIGAAERNSEKLKLQMQAEQQRLTTLQLQTESQRRELGEAASMLQKEKQQVANGKQLQVERLTQQDEAEKRTEQTRARLDTEFGKCGDLEQHARQVQLLFDESQERQANDEKLLQTLSDAVIKHNQELFDARKLEANTVADISGLQVSLKNVQSQIVEKDQQSIGQQEMLYGIEFQLVQMERKVSRAGGKRTFSEKAELNVQIDKLNGDLAAERKQERMLVGQVKRIEIDLAACRKKLAATRKELAQLNESMNEHMLENQTSEVELANFEVGRWSEGDPLSLIWAVHRPRKTS